MAKLTLADLKAAKACNRDTAIFERLYGTGNDVTLARVMAGSLEFDWSRASILLTPKQRQYYRVLCLAAFRQVEKISDKNGHFRKKAMAKAFFLAYNSSKE